MNEFKPINVPYIPAIGDNTSRLNWMNTRIDCYKAISHFCNDFYISSNIFQRTATPLSYIISAMREV